MQDLAVDLLYYYPTIRDPTARVCALLCLTETYPLSLAQRVIDCLTARRNQQASSAVISFLVTVLLGRVSQAQLAVLPGRHAVLVEAACRTVTNLASPGTLSFIHSFNTCWLARLKDLARCMRKP